MSHIKSFFGIDFGTTNSAVVGIRYSENNMQDIRYGDEYDYPFPSLVIIDSESGEVYCGRKAWEERRCLSEHAEVITSVKSYLDTDKKWEIAGREWTAVDVTAEIFAALKGIVRKKSGIEMEEAVVSIPVGFSPGKRKMLRAAAKKAGLEVKSFISESTAAVFKNFKQMKKYKNIAVFDWGGGTLDVSIIKNDNGKIEELATDGLKLGGDDIDLKIAQWAHKVIMKSKKGNKRFEDMSLSIQDNMILKSERAKKDLSDEESTVISIPKYGEYGISRVLLDEERFSLLIENEVDEAIDFFEKVVKRASVSMLELECIVMVGGSSNLTPLIDKISEQWADQFDIEIVYPDESEWDVASGTAMLSKNPGGFKINQKLGLELSDDSYYPILERNQDISFEREDIFSIVRDEKEARFIFTDEKQTLGYEKAPVYGFFQEIIKCKSYIDEDLVFNMEIKSENKPNKYSIKWQYPNLNYYYELPDLEGDACE